MQVKAQRFFHDAAPPGHPGISITRPTPSQRLRFGDFGRRLAPSGEVLAWLLAKGTWDFTGKRVLELGSGLGLSGMACAAWTGCSSVLLTDGDPVLVEVLGANAALNKEAGAFADAEEAREAPAPDDWAGAAGRGGCHVQTAFLDWLAGGSVEEGCFDVILCADCVYNVELHIPLLKTLRRFLRPDGKVILIASPRAGSLYVFLSAARGFFGSVTCTVDYDDVVSSKFRGQKCFPQLVTLESLECNRFDTDDLSIFEDEHSKRFVERRRRALQEEEERTRQIHCRYGVRPAQLRTTALSTNEVKSMIERMVNPKTRGSRRPGVGGVEGDEREPATDDLHLPRSQAVQFVAQVPRPSTSESSRSLSPKADHDPNTIRCLREAVQQALRGKEHAFHSRNTPCATASGGSCSEHTLGEETSDSCSSRLLQSKRPHGRLYYHCDDQEESSVFGFYKHLQDKPQRPIDPTWVLNDGSRSCQTRALYPLRFHRTGQVQQKLWHRRDKVLVIPWPTAP